MDNYGIITLLPPILIIVFALITKKTFEALVLGGLVGCVIAYGTGFFGGYLDFLYETMSDTGNIWVILTVGIFGSFIAIMRKAKATSGFTALVLKYSNSEKKSMMISWIMGIIIFVDEYLNVLTIGNVMRSVCDKQKTPREMLAYVIDSTGVPVCMLIPISTQAVYWAGMLAEEKELAYLGSGMDIFIKTIPFSFYAMAATVIVPLVILGVIPKIGPMKKAYQRTLNTGMTYNEGSKKFNLTVEDPDENTSSLWDFFLPMIALIAGTFYFDVDLLHGVIIGTVVASAMYLIRRRITFNEFSEAFISGFADMFLMFAIIISALTLQKVLAAIGMSDFIVNAVAPYMSPALLPAMAFIIVAVLSFVTGSCWGVPAVTLPIIVPLGMAVGADPVLTVAAILSSATFGAHACFYSDATVLSSSAAGIENMDHALTQIPYALIAGGVAIMGFLVTGFIMA
ncbi:sodium:proton antiporter [Anaerovorax odorimutans]|uniref:Sodium:proton antiporter n=1 Tax=Anaerovorax odorimutans TaxID=109327 RepID=A0ABT1RS31_9FIRM|nr:Na+/H+ antiporter NhaC family protein [Anaerovorax odorimutans]MCQ4638010.1 sodium:proton antiporter [Anaerovorax odorimutans]